MSRNDDYLMLRLVVDEDGELSIHMSGYFPNKDATIIATLTALGYGVLGLLKDEQGEITNLGLDYMKAHGITFASLLPNTPSGSMVH
jgi:hypothetical protein